jgi:hypothetical protein
MTCIFREELEICHHLFRECVVISNMWLEVKSVLGINFGPATLVDIFVLQNNKKKKLLVSMINVVILRIIWLARNNMVFEHNGWDADLMEENNHVFSKQLLG